MDYLETIKMLLEILLLLAAFPATLIAVFQLTEMKKQRLSDMSLRIYEIYTSAEMDDSRNELYKTEPDMTDASAYINKYHNAGKHTRHKKTDRKIRVRIRFLNQIGILIGKKLLNNDLLFELIGTSLEMDHKMNTFVISAHRTAHNEDNMYDKYDYLYARYVSWKSIKGKHLK